MDNNVRLKKTMFGKGSDEEVTSVIIYIRRAMSRRWRILEYTW